MTTAAEFLVCLAAMAGVFAAAAIIISIIWPEEF